LCLEIASHNKGHYLVDLGLAVFPTQHAATYSIVDVARHFELWFAAPIETLRFALAALDERKSI
jgi:hypothetical protein